MGVGEVGREGRRVRKGVVELRKVLNGSACCLQAMSSYFVHVMWDRNRAESNCSVSGWQKQNPVCPSCPCLSISE